MGRLQAMITGSSDGRKFDEDAQYEIAKALVTAFKGELFGEMLKLKGTSLQEAHSWPDKPEEVGPTIGKEKKIAELPPKQRKEYDFWESVARNGFDITTDGKKNPQQAGRWQRALKCPERRMKYEAVWGDIAKAEFRAKWAKEQHGKVTKNIIQVTEEVRTQWKESSYLPVGRIAWLEGGGKVGWANVGS